MKKDIYLIKNILNNKVYVGQSVNYKHRWEQHISASRHSPQASIDKAIQSDGECNFQLIKLETVENYDERECFWIKQYNSTNVEYGYNITCGGHIVRGLDNPFSKIQTSEQLSEVIDLIRNSHYSFDMIAKQYNVSPAVISAINLGTSYFQDELDYPIRLTRFEEEKFNQLVYSLKYELDKSMTDLAKEYEVLPTYVHDVNNGRTRYRTYLQYPLRNPYCYRKGCGLVSEIVNLLKHSTLSQKQIAIKLKVSENVIAQINVGRAYHKNGETYPIRQNIQRKSTNRACLSPNELRQIESLLKDKKVSCEQISKQFGLAITTVHNINNGTIIKYHNPHITYPIRSK